jgi:hypothetical protein
MNRRIIQWTMVNIKFRYFIFWNITPFCLKTRHHYFTGSCTLPASTESTVQMEALDFSKICSIQVWCHAPKCSNLNFHHLNNCSFKVVLFKVNETASINLLLPALHVSRLYTHQIRDHTVVMSTRCTKRVFLLSSHWTRQRHCIESLQMPGYFATATVFRIKINATECTMEFSKLPEITPISYQILELKIKRVCWEAGSCMIRE